MQREAEEVSPRRVFLDVGAYDGVSTRQVLDAGYAFDRYYCVEPQPFLVDVLREKMTDPRVEVVPCGLGMTSGLRPFYRGSKLVSGSLYAAKRFWGPVRTSSVIIREATEWFRETFADEDRVVARMNCEGAEADILENLLLSGEIRKVHGLAVAWDLRKVPGQERRLVRLQAAVARTVPKVFELNDAEANRLGDAYTRVWMEAIV